MKQGTALLELEFGVRARREGHGSQLRDVLTVGGLGRSGGLSPILSGT